MHPKPALFLDRDGVLNVDKGYVSRVEDFEWTTGAAACVRRFNQLGWRVFVVTNQSGIARGYYTEADMHALHDWMLNELSKFGAHIDRIYYAPWHPEGEIAAYRRQSDDRKPGPGMLLRAMAEYPVKREASFLIGDKQSDLDAAKAAGVAGFLYSSGNLADFAEWAKTTLLDGGR
ncbi:MAG: HAD family hydrolase [Pseudomonadota bacterium]